MSPVAANHRSQAGSSSPIRLAGLTLGALGVVFGDIGTSPLYAMRECFHPSHQIGVTPDNILGVLSLIIWSLIGIISIKYLMFVMRADNRGEGGVFSLLSILQDDLPRNDKRRKMIFIFCLISGAMLFSDATITPAISVLSAVEGLTTITPQLESFVVPITLVIITLLFINQRRGTASLGKIFGPVMLVWFSVLGLLGIMAIIKEPKVLLAFNPWYGIQFFWVNELTGFKVLGSVFLVITGGEALYVDMGHFGRNPIRNAWFTIAFPGLLLNYLGQGAVLIKTPDAVESLFYRLAPTWALWPVIILATIATVIASQAVISGTYSLAKQAIQLGLIPRLKIVQTSEEFIGQIYLPAINWLLFAISTGLVLNFKNSSNLAAAYGVAVSSSMLITSVLMTQVASTVWHWRPLTAIGFWLLFIIPDLAFSISNMMKFVSGGWIPIVMALILYLIMTTWESGRDLMNTNISGQALPVELFLKDIVEKKPTRVPGTAVFLTGSGVGIPRTLLHNLIHNKILHETIILLTVKTQRFPYVPADQRVQLEELGHGLFRMKLAFGFHEVPNLSGALKGVDVGGKKIKVMNTTFFLGRENLIVNRNKSQPYFPYWRRFLYSILFRNAYDAATFFNIPPNRVVELGRQIEI